MAKISDLARICSIGLFVAGLGLALSSCRYQPEGESGENWAYHHGGQDEQGYSPLREIDTSNVSRLGLEYALELPGETMLEAEPLAIDGVLYFTGGRLRACAVDAVTGRLLWSYVP